MCGRARKRPKRIIATKMTVVPEGEAIAFATNVSARDLLDCLVGEDKQRWRNVIAVSV
jgi:hypothetical protein